MSAFRVLKPGGRFAVSDVVVRGDVPPEIKEKSGALGGFVSPGP
jgi:arsenite methyltransferase